VLVTRVGVRPLLMAGPLLAGSGFLLLSRLSVDGTYWPDLLPKLLLVSAGLGLMFVPLTLMVVSHVRDQDAGAASGVMNVGQQIGGAIGLAAIGTIAWTSVAHSVQDQIAAGGAATAGAAAQSAGGVPAPILHQALTDGFSTGLMIAGFVTLSAFVVAIVTTWTPGWRVSSAVHEVEPSCDEALGTCDAATA
jgi:hypothetical protein